MYLKSRNIINSIILSCVALLVMWGFPAYSGDTEGMEQARLLVTPVLVASDVSDHVLENVSHIIEKNLQVDDYFYINEGYAPESGISFNKYLTGSCLTDLASVIPGGIIILVAVKKARFKVGEKQHSRYVTEDLIETRYTLYVSTVDLSAGRYDLKFRETCSDPLKLSDQADYIGRKIREFYTGKKPGGNNTGDTGSVKIFFPVCVTGQVKLQSIQSAGCCRKTAKMPLYC